MSIILVHHSIVVIFYSKLEKVSFILVHHSIVILYSKLEKVSFILVHHSIVVIIFSSKATL